MTLKKDDIFAFAVLLFSATEQWTAHQNLTTE